MENHSTRLFELLFDMQYPPVESKGHFILKTAGGFATTMLHFT